MHVILDRLYALDCACKVDRLVDAFLGTDETAQLNGAFEVSTLISADFSEGSWRMACFHFGGNNGIIDILAGSFTSGS